MPHVRLHRLAPSDFHLVEGLSVTTEQRRFLSTPDLQPFLEDAHRHPTYQPFAVCDGDDVVGFVSVGVDPGDSALAGFRCC